MGTEREAALQYDMFTGQLVDARTKTQKQKALLRSLPQQQEMFPSPTNAAYQRVNAHPLIPIPDHVAVPYQWIDARTEEEIEADRLREAVKYIIPMFPEIKVSQPQTPLLLASGQPQFLLTERSVVTRPSDADTTALFRCLMDKVSEMERASQAMIRQLEERTIFSAAAEVETHHRPSPPMAYALSGAPKTPLSEDNQLSSGIRHNRDRIVPIGWIDVADMAATHPGLEDVIFSLTDYELDQLADNLYDAMYEDYWIAFEEILMAFLAWREGMEESPRTASHNEPKLPKTDMPSQKTLPLE